MGIGIAAGLLATLAVSVLPALNFAYRNDEANVAIETAASLVPARAALLFAGRAVRALVDFLVQRFGPEPSWDPCWIAQRQREAVDRAA